MTVIALIGEKGVGKDYLADLVVSHHGARKHAFADSLKRISNEIFPWLPEHIEPSAKDVPWPASENTCGLTPREIWLALSDGLKKIDPLIFFNHFLATSYREIQETPDTIHPITDFRLNYPEWNFLCRECIPVIKIVSPNPPVTPHDFERWTRNFDQQDATFTNTKDSTSEQDWLNFFHEFILKPHLHTTK